MSQLLAAVREFLAAREALDAAPTSNSRAFDAALADHNASLGKLSAAVSEGDVENERLRKALNAVHLALRTDDEADWYVATKLTKAALSEQEGK